MRLIPTVIFVLAAAEAALACCQYAGKFGCCGKGKCNIFCCNCDNGCKPKNQCGKSQSCINKCLKKDPRNVDCIAYCAINKRDTTPNDPFADNEHGIRGLEARAEIDAQQFAEVDINGNGNFTYVEFLKRMDWEDNAGSKEHFDEFDQNGDGVITPGEMRGL